jgi:glycosyltransferase involved in cell wall biosynthesis
MSTPRVTVGMPTYNRAHILRETIQYVLDQTYEDFELLIFDDGSTDGSAEVAQSVSDPRITFLGSRRCGPPHPLNELYQRARGEFVIILHDHDIFNPTLLQKSVEALDRNSSAAFVLQGAALIGEDGVSNYREVLENRPELNPGRRAGSEMLRKVRSFASTFHACSMVRASALEKVGRYYEVQYGLHADVDLWLRLLRHFDFCYLKEVLFLFRERGAGHFLHGKDADVLNRMRHMFLRNGLEYFHDDPLSLSEMLENIRTEYTAQELRAAARAVVRRLPDWRRCMQRIASNPMHGTLTRNIAAFFGVEGSVAQARTKRDERYSA